MYLFQSGFDSLKDSIWFEALRWCTAGRHSLYSWAVRNNTETFTDLFNPGYLWASIVKSFFFFQCQSDEVIVQITHEPAHDKTNKMIRAPSEDSDQPGHPPSPNRVFAVCMKIHWVLSNPLSAQRKLWSDWADTQADLSLRWVQRSFCWFCHAAAHIAKFGVIFILYHGVSFKVG